MGEHRPPLHPPFCFTCICLTLQAFGCSAGSGVAILLGSIASHCCARGDVGAEGLRLGLRQPLSLPLPTSFTGGYCVLMFLLLE